jgi:hypothetical protein
MVHGEPSLAALKALKVGGGAPDATTLGDGRFMLSGGNQRPAAAARGLRPAAGRREKPRAVTRPERREPPEPPQEVDSGLRDPPLRGREFFEAVIRENQLGPNTPSGWAPRGPWPCAPPRVGIGVKSRRGSGFLLLPDRNTLTLPDQPSLAASSASIAATTCAYRPNVNARIGRT